MMIDFLRRHLSSAMLAAGIMLAPRYSRPMMAKLLSAINGVGQEIERGREGGIIVSGWAISDEGRRLARHMEAAALETAGAIRKGMLPADSVDLVRASLKALADDGYATDAQRQTARMALSSMELTSGRIAELARDLRDIRPMAEELLKIAGDLDCRDDPFSAWESIEALNDRAEKAEARVKELEGKAP